MMKRKGIGIIYFASMAALVVAGALVGNLFFHQYVGSLEANVEETSKTQFQGFALREEILNADCITKQRGVFYKSKIADNPDALTCISQSEEPIRVVFHIINKEGVALSITDETHSYKITPQGPGEPSEVVKSADDRTLDDILDSFTTKMYYPIVVYDESTSEYHQAVLTYTQ